MAGNYGSLGTIWAEMGLDTSKLHAGYKESERILSRTESSVARFEGGLTRIGQTAARTGKMLSIGLTAPLLLLGRQAVNTGAQYETAMTNVWTLTDWTTEQFQDMSEAVLEMTRDIPQSAQVLANGLYQVVSAGVDAEHAMYVLEVSAKAATAGLTDTATAVDAITTVINAYGLEAQEAERISDIMFRTVERGKITFPEMAGSLGQVVSTAATVGIEFEELAATFATLTKGGINAAEASTAVNQALLGFIRPTDNAREVAEAFGVELKATVLEQKGFVGALNDIFDATGGNIEVLGEMFGSVRALKGILGLTRGEMQDYINDVNAMEDATGAMESAFQKQMGTFTSQWTIFKNLINEVMIGISVELMPIVMALIQQYIVPLISWIQGLNNEQRKWIVYAGMVAAALGPLMLMAGKLAGALKALLPLVAAINLKFTIIAGVIGGVVWAIDNLRSRANLLHGDLSDMGEDDLTRRLELLEKELKEAEKYLEEFRVTYGRTMTDEQFDTFAAGMIGPIHQRIEETKAALDELHETGETSPDMSDWEAELDRINEKIQEDIDERVRRTQEEVQAIWEAYQAGADAQEDLALRRLRLEEQRIAHEVAMNRMSIDQQISEYERLLETQELQGEDYLEVRVGLERKIELLGEQARADRVQSALDEYRFNSRLYEFQTEDHISYIEGVLDREELSADERKKLEQDVALYRAQLRREEREDENRRIDYLFRSNQLATDDYLDHLQERLEGLEEYSSEWIRTMEQITQIQADANREQLRMEEGRIRHEVSMNRMSIDEQVAEYGRLLNEIELTEDERLDIQRRIEQLEEQSRRSTVQSALSEYRFKSRLYDFSTQDHINYIEGVLEREDLSADERKSLQQDVALYRKQLIKEEMEATGRKMNYLYRAEEISKEDYIMFLEERLKALEKYSYEWIRIMEELNSLRKEKTEELIEEEKTMWQEAQDAMEQTFTDNLARMLERSETFSSAWKNIIADMRGFFARAIAQMATEWMKAEFAKQMAVAKTTQAATGATTSMVAQTVAAISGMVKSVLATLGPVGWILAGLGAVAAVRASHSQPSIDHSFTDTEAAIRGGQLAPQTRQAVAPVSIVFEEGAVQIINPNKIDDILATLVPAFTRRLEEEDITWGVS